MREVTQTEFYKTMGPLNVHPQVVGKYPYTSIFRDQQTMAEVGRAENGETGQPSKYFLVDHQGAARV